MLDFDAILTKLAAIWTEAIAIWTDGGWAMIPILVIAVVMFGIGVHVWLGLRATGFSRVPESSWRDWIESPQERHGPVGDLIDFVTNTDTIDDTVAAFRSLRTTELTPFERDLRITKICVSAAPLVGLLGTVTGMLETFSALSSGSGGEQTMNQVAGGISEALITTMTGLVVALPGLFFQYQLQRGFERYRAFLAHMETVCVQVMYRDARAEMREAARQVAKAKVAATLKERIQSGARPEPDSDIVAAAILAMREQVAVD